MSTWENEIFGIIYIYFAEIILHMNINPSNTEATSVQSTKMQRIYFENHLNPVMLVFIR